MGPCSGGSLSGRPTGKRPPYSNERAVRILLECILVMNQITHCKRDPKYIATGLHQRHMSNVLVAQKMNPFPITKQPPFGDPSIGWSPPFYNKTIWYKVKLISTIPVSPLANQSLYDHNHIFREILVVAARFYYSTNCTRNKKTCSTNEECKLTVRVHPRLEKLSFRLIY